MTEEEARKVLREFMERPDKGKEWPKVWIGEVVSADELGYLFQATYYGPGWKPEDGFQTWGVDAKTKECMFNIM
ncbi:MAG: hypothetical protein K2H64_12365 [Desulfovibrio sp.]|nr:hypothetical protein [Desulfovibrio sp.]